MHYKQSMTNRMKNITIAYARFSDLGNKHKDFEPLFIEKNIGTEFKNKATLNTQIVSKINFYFDRSTLQ